MLLYLGLKSDIIRLSTLLTWIDIPQPVPEMGGRTVTLDPISRGLPGWALSLDDLEPEKPDEAEEP